MGTKIINFSNGKIEHSNTASCNYGQGDETEKYYVGNEVSKEEYEKAAENVIDRSKAKKIQYYSNMPQAITNKGDK